jgi:rhodanese-related sulfurtransferase
VITTGYKQLMAEAESRVAGITALEAMEQGSKLTIVDIRDIRELERDGRIPGSFHAPRGMLEFWVDPESPYFKPIFGEDRTFVLHCASGWRSLLATDTLRKMGLEPVLNLKGGFTAWKEAGGPVEQLVKKKP